MLMLQFGNQPHLWRRQLEKHRVTFVEKEMGLLLNAKTQGVPAMATGASEEVVANINWNRDLMSCFVAEFILAKKTYRNLS